MGGLPFGSLQQHVPRESFKRSLSSSTAAFTPCRACNTLHRRDVGSASAEPAVRGELMWSRFIAIVSCLPLWVLQYEMIILLCQYRDWQCMPNGRSPCRHLTSDRGCRRLATGDIPVANCSAPARKASSKRLHASCPARCSCSNVPSLGPASVEDGTPARHATMGCCIVVLVGSSVGDEKGTLTPQTDSYIYCGACIGASAGRVIGNDLSRVLDKNILDRSQ